MKGFLVRDGLLSSAGAAGSRRCPEEQFSSCTGSIDQGDQQSVDGDGVSTPCGPVSTG